MISEIYSIYFDIYLMNGAKNTCIFFVNSLDNMDKFLKSLFASLN
jgi:hypothetical protein